MQNQYGRKKTTVLVGFAEALSAPEVVWSLVDSGFEVFAFARKGRRSALHHSLHAVCHEITPPALDLEAALSDLRSLLVSLNLTNRRKVHVLLPLDDIAIWLCSKVAPESGWILAGPDRDRAQLALDKFRQIQAAGDAGFNVPETRTATSPDEIMKADIPFPIMLKPANAISIQKGRILDSSTWICADGGELEKALSAWAARVPVLVQPYIRGTGMGVFGIATQKGVRAWSSHRRLRMMNPQGSGSSACISQSVPDGLKVLVERFVRNTGWNGLFMIELLRDCSGKVWFMELNGRSWGSMALARRQGLEYPAWSIELALNQDPYFDTELYASSGMVCRHVGRELMHLLFVLRGPKSSAQANWPSFSSAVMDVLRVRRGESFYNWRKDDPKVFISDCYYTIHDQVLKPKR